MSLPNLVATLADTGLQPVNPADSPNVDRINHSYWLIFALTVPIFLIVEGALVYFIVRYRRRGRARDVEGPQVRGHTRLELMWTVVPVLIVTGIIAFVFYKLPGIEDVPRAEAAAGPLEVDVEGRQYYWRYVYPNGAISWDTLYAPVGRPVVARIKAPAYDVIHSWWIPSLGGKFDAIPGQTVETWFQARRTGTFEGQCGEYCGIQHGAMLARATILSRDEYERWASDQAGALRARSPELGSAIFEAACAKCHALETTEVIVGPSLRGNATLRNREALEQIVRNGREAMPAVGRGWTDAEFEALFAFVSERGEVDGG